VASNDHAHDAIRFIAIGSNIETELYVITNATFQKILGQYRTFRTQIKEALTELEKELKEEKRPLPSRLPGVIKEAPVTKVVAVILKHAVEGKASDIHIESVAVRTRVRFRVHGGLYTSLFLPSRIHNALVSRIKILSNLRLDETRIPQDGRFSAEISGRTIDFRVSTFPTWLGEKVVLRVLDPYGAIQDLESLGLAGRNLTLIKEAIKRPFGMVMISGPTGSGKSSTLYAALSSMDRETVNAISLEDPIEYHIEGVSQSQIRNEIGYTFASGLRHVLRQDPDIIMVGEVRDAETAELAVHASLTGHLVFSTIHTNNAVGVVTRLQDMGVPFFLIPSAIVLTVAQRLVSRLCPYCKVKEKAPDNISAIVRQEIEGMSAETRAYFKVKPEESYVIWHSPGCDKCARKGILGRIGIFESLSMTTQLKKLVYDKANAIILQEEAARQGMITLRQDGILKALQGIVAVEEVLRVVEEE
jgi:type IV pilus assembly protein PilB